LHEVLNKRNAVFCPPQDLAAWRQALSELFSDESRRIELGEHARQDAALYTWRGRVQRALQGW
jgi:glycosyltransferase involved in cell wall biosynthesis